MDYKVDKSGQDIVVTLSGDVTFSENAVFRQMLKDIDGQGGTSCTFDISDVGMVDSAGLGMFLIAKDQTDKAGCALKVTGASGHVASMLKLTKLSDLLG